MKTERYTAADYQFFAFVLGVDVGALWLLWILVPHLRMLAP